MSPPTPTPRLLARLPRQTWSVPEWETDRRQRSCERKNAYPTRQEAVDTAAVQVRFARLLRPYHCERCGHWHLTSQARRTDR